MIPTQPGQPVMGAPQAQAPQPGQPSGMDKWAIDGFHNLKDHVGDDDRSILMEAKDKMLLDPKMRNLLATASNYQPGSKPLDQIITHLKSHLGVK